MASGSAFKLMSLLFGGVLFLVAVPAVGLYSAASTGLRPIDYNIWVLLFFVYALVVLVGDLNRS